MKVLYSMSLLVPIEYVDIVNDRLKHHGYGPNNISRECINGSAVVTHKCGTARITEIDKRSLPLLLDRYPIVQYNITSKSEDSLSSLLEENNLTIKPREE